MSTYAIGDIQGCFAAFSQLLNKIQFNPSTDTLWITGDLVNRGPQSLEVLRLIKSFGEKHIIVLGNHDLHLLAVAYNAHPLKPGDTLTELLNAPDKLDLIEWLRHQPLLHYDSSIQFIMAHAGIAPMWTLEQACQLAQEVETTLQ